MQLPTMDILAMLGNVDVLFQSSKTSLVEKQLQFAYDTHRYGKPFVL